MKRLPPILLIISFCLSSWAQTNVVKRTLPFATDHSITYFPKDSGILIRSPNYKSKIKLPKTFSFNETQKWDIIKLLEKYSSFSMALEENDMKFFSKSLGSIPQASENVKWAIGLDATIYVSQEGKALLVLESKTKLTETSSVIVLDASEVHYLIELIKMIPDMQKELSTDQSK